MILIDEPYVSDFFLDTIKKYNLPVVNTAVAQSLGLVAEQYLISEKEAVRRTQTSDNPQIYTTSENAIGWINNNLAATCLPQKIDLFKNKSKFRVLSASSFPDFFFKIIPYDDLDTLSLEELPYPFIIKPAAGFFSKGVHKVSSPANWESLKKSIKSEILSENKLYPPEVLNTASFIIEQYIPGDEFAIDAYYNHEGDPVITNIFHHIFPSGDNVADRIYISSKEIIEDHLQEFTEFLAVVGRQAGVTNFPVHAEIRLAPDGSLLPIEINPMRFGGWCTTADLTYFAYGFNPYVYYFRQQRPDWSKLLAGKEGKIYSIIILDNSSGVDGQKIAHFDYDKLVANFNKPLDLRKIDFKEYPVFGFLFTETKKEDFFELDRILRSDLSEFITTNP